MYDNDLEYCVDVGKMCKEFAERERTEKTTGSILYESAREDQMRFS